MTQMPSNLIADDLIADDLVADDAIALGVVGPPDHGITRLARQIADAAADSGFRGTILQESDPGALETVAVRLGTRTRLLHLHVNDWLFTTERRSAGLRLAKLAERLAESGVSLSLTLHDLPQPSDGPELTNRRRENYRSMVGAAVGTAVSSDHERELLVRALAVPGHGDSSIEVIPLPIDSMPATRPPDPAANDRPPTIGIFGYLYPGKGHREVLEELAGMDTPLTVEAIGAPSERHGDLLAELEAVAGNAGIGFRCTGYVPDAEVATRLRQVLIPVAPHTHVSASGSINSWLAAGRRPLVPAGRYVEELDRRLPGAVWIYQPGELRRCVEMALRAPELTMLPTHLEVGPGIGEVTEEYLAWLRRLVLPT